MMESSFVETNEISEAEFIVFDKNLEGRITQGKLYKIFMDKPIGFDAGTGHGSSMWQWCSESYFIRDDGRKDHGTWIWHKAKFLRCT